MFENIITFWQDNIPVDAEYEERSGFNPIKMRHQRLVGTLHRQVEQDEEQMRKWGKALKETVMAATAQQESRMSLFADRYDDACLCFGYDSELFEKAALEFEQTWGEPFVPWKPENRVTVGIQATLQRLLDGNFITRDEAVARGYSAAVDRFLDSKEEEAKSQPNEAVERLLTEDNGDEHEGSRELTNAG